MARERLFRFKQFAVSHSASAMKVGTDGVTLGAWAPCSGRVLDVGCGCGLIGLMAAQRGAREVVMVEIDPAAATEAAANAESSPWSGRVGVICADYARFEASRPFDSIISNPPFFAEGMLAPDDRRASARHEGRLTPDLFFGRAAGMLAPDGKVSVILPPDRVDAWRFAALTAGLHPSARCALLAKPEAPPRRVMLTFGRDSSVNCHESTLLINSPEYNKLTSPFYL